MSLKTEDTFSHSGFTLVEIVVATVILAIAMLGIMSAFISGTKLVAASKYRLQAINYAQGILEGLRQEVRADTWNLSGSALSIQSADNPHDCIGTNPLVSFGGTCQYTVTDIDGGSDPNLPRKVDVIVGWTKP